MAYNPLTNIDRAERAWGATMPEWVRLLATACDRTSQNAVGAKLGKSSGYVSRVINGNYNGDLREAEGLVRATFGSETVQCPVMGPIPLASCRQNRRRKGTAVNLLHRLWARHCPDCPNNTDRAE